MYYTYVLEMRVYACEFEYEGRGLAYFFIYNSNKIIIVCLNQNVYYNGIIEFVYTVHEMDGS